MLRDMFLQSGLRVFSVVFHGFSGFQNRELLLTQVGLLSVAFRCLDNTLDILFFGLRLLFGSEFL